MAVSGSMSQSQAGKALKDFGDHFAWHPSFACAHHPHRFMQKSTKRFMLQITSRAM
jgi:hypothetical protein